MNTITIRKPDQPTGPATMFKAPDDPHAARALWLFLAENLQPGFVLELASADGRAITQPSGGAAGLRVTRTNPRDGLQ